MQFDLDAHLDPYVVTTRDLLACEIGHLVLQHLDTRTIDYTAIMESASLRILQQIKEAVNQPDRSDFEILDAVVELLIKHNIDSGFNHEY